MTILQGSTPQVILGVEVNCATCQSVKGPVAKSVDHTEGHMGLCTLGGHCIPGQKAVLDLAILGEDFKYFRDSKVIISWL